MAVEEEVPWPDVVAEQRHNAEERNDKDRQLETYAQADEMKVRGNAWTMTNITGKQQSPFQFVKGR